MLTPITDKALHGTGRITGKSINRALISRAFCPYAICLDFNQLMVCFPKFQFIVRRHTRIVKLQIR